MHKSKAWVLRDFRVFVAPDGGVREGHKEILRRFRKGEEIECTPEQLEVGKAAGLLADERPEDTPANAVRDAAPAAEEDIA